MKQKQHLGVSTHPRVCGFASKNIYKFKKISKNKSQLESLQTIPTALKERHEIIMDSNQLIVFDSWISCATRIQYESNGISVVFEEYCDNIFETINDSIEATQFWRYFLVLDKKTGYLIFRVVFSTLFFYACFSI